MSFTMITVTDGPVKDLDGQVAAGTYLFRLSDTITNGTESYLDSEPVRAVLGTNGNLSVILPANDDPATTPANSTYVVTQELDGMAPEIFSITVPYNAAGGTVTLSSLRPATVGDGL